jgi:hypothetical protein
MHVMSNPKADFEPATNRAEYHLVAPSAVKNPAVVPFQ